MNESIFQTYLYGCVFVLSICTLLVASRLLRGPRLQDRVVAIDLMTTLGVAIIVVYSLATGEAALMDVAIIVALLSFLGTVAFAYYGERMFRE